MKRRASIALASVGIAGFVLLTSTAFAQAPGVSATVNVNVPGVYGQITIGGALTRDFRDPQSAEFQWTPWDYRGSGDATVMYCGEVNAKGAAGNYEGYVPYLAAVLVKAGKIVDAVLIGTHFPSPARHGSPMRQCIGKVDGL